MSYYNKLDRAGRNIKLIEESHLQLEFARRTTKALLKVAIGTTSQFSRHIPDGSTERFELEETFKDNCDSVWLC